MIWAATTSQDPWLLITLAIIGASGGILAAVLGFMSKRHASDTKAAITNAVGIPNGHGPLMTQTEQLLQNQQVIHTNLYDVNARLSEHILATHKNLEDLGARVEIIHEDLKAHIAWSEYMTKVKL